MTDPKDDADFLTLCKDHKAELNIRIPWQNRGDGLAAIHVMNEMIEEVKAEYKKTEEESTQGTEPEE